MFLSTKLVIKEQKKKDMASRSKKKRKMWSHYFKFSNSTACETFEEGMITLLWHDPAYKKEFSNPYVNLMYKNLLSVHYLLSTVCLLM